MAQIRKIEIKNFRSIYELHWSPAPGVNCLIGPGDSGKSTILDAIDWCIGSRHTVSVTDADFNIMNTENKIIIEVTLGGLHDGLKNLDLYGHYLRGLAENGDIEDEPSEGLETTLTVRLTIGDDLEPQWTLISERAQAQGLSRNLSWADRLRIAPTRIGAYANYHLTWQQGSILNLLSDEKADTSAQLAQAARDARNTFGDSAGEQLEKTLSLVAEAAASLGIPVGDEVRAMLDPHSVSFSGGTISLHDSNGVPLRKLGLGSSRLLVAGLQNKAVGDASMVLIDEIEIGLEPHRIARFLRAVGSKDEDNRLQVFMTTHSPTVARELAADQLNIIRSGDSHIVIHAGDTDDIQGALRSEPEAFFGSHVLICEGATEVGLIRGIDLYRDEQNQPTFATAGGVTVDAGGVSKIYKKANPFTRLGYHASILRDDDKKPDANDEQTFEVNGGSVFKWTEDRAFEDEMFNCLDEDTVYTLWNYAGEVHGANTVLDHLKSACNEAVDTNEWFDDLDNNKRDKLAEAAKSGNWFKRISIMERAAHKIIAPNLPTAKEEFRAVIDNIYAWAGIE